jgi:cytochrome c-type biogenesis protein CcmF
MELLCAPISDISGCPMESGTAWQRARIPIAVTAVALLTAAIAGVGRSPAALICMGVCAFVATVIVQELTRGARSRQKASGGSFLGALASIIFKARQPHTGYLVHLGVVLMFVGFAGQAFQREESAVIATGETKDFAGYRLRFDGITQSQDLIKQTYQAEIAVSSGGKSLGRLRPGREFYDQRPNEPVSQVAIRRGIGEDLYIPLGSYDDAQRALALKLVLNPLVDWMWLGFLVMAFGTLLILAPRPQQESDARGWSWSSVAIALGVASLTALLGKAVLHMPVSAQLATFTLCGLSVGLAGLACYKLLGALLSPADESVALEQ